MKALNVHVMYMRSSVISLVFIGSLIPAGQMYQLQ